VNIYRFTQKKDRKYIERRERKEKKRGKKRIVTYIKKE